MPFGTCHSPDLRSCQHNFLLCTYFFRLEEVNCYPNFDIRRQKLHKLKNTVSDGYRIFFRYTKIFFSSRYRLHLRWNQSRRISRTVCISVVNTKDVVKGGITVFTWYLMWRQAERKQKEHMARRRYCQWNPRWNIPERTTDITWKEELN